MYLAAGTAFALASAAPKTWASCRCSSLRRKPLQRPLLDPSDERSDSSAEISAEVGEASSEGAEGAERTPDSSADK